MSHAALNLALVGRTSGRIGRVAGSKPIGAKRSRCWPISASLRSRTSAITSPPSETAREYLREAVQLIPQIPPQWQSDRLDTLTAVARLKACEQPLRAIELFAFVIAHPLTYYHVRVAAQQLLDDLLTKVSPDDARTAQQRGETTTLEEIVSRL